MTFDELRAFFLKDGAQYRQQFAGSSAPSAPCTGEVLMLIYQADNLRRLLHEALDANTRLVAEVQLNSQSMLGYQCNVLFNEVRSLQARLGIPTR